MFILRESFSLRTLKLTSLVEISRPNLLVVFAAFVDFTRDAK